MIDDNPNLGTKLAELADTPAPAMIIDVDRARRMGRRHRMQRRGALLAGVVAVAVATGLVAPTALNTLRPQSETAGPADPTTNPMIAYATFGWLPDSITRIDYGRGGHGEYTHAVNENDGLGTHLWLVVHPAGDPPELAWFKQEPNGQHNVPAEPVNGQIAYWATVDTADPLNDGDAHLLWQLPSGQWVVLQGYYLSFFADPAATLQRVAAAVTVEERALPLPIRITGLRTDVKVDEATWYAPMSRLTGTGAWQLQLSYSQPNAGPLFGLTVNPAGTVTEKSEKPPTCRTVNELDICVHHRIQRAEPLPPAEVEAILDSVTSLGLDERNWTTDPIG